MKNLSTMLGLKWDVYKNYYFIEKNNKTYITADFTEDNIQRSYYPNEYKREKKRRKFLFIEFAEAEPDKKNVFNLVKNFGLLKTSTADNKQNNNEIKGDLLEDIFLEIKALKKAWQIYKGTIDLHFFSELKRIIKFKSIEEETDYSNPKANIKKQIIVEQVLETDPFTYITVNKNEKLDSDIYQLSAMQYLLNTISNNIKINGGAIPTYFAIYLTDAETDETLNCSFVPNLECNNLAASLWIQFYNFISNGPVLIKCKNDRCKEVFLKEGKKEYHNENCRIAQNMRDYWRYLKVRQIKLLILLIIFKKTNNFASFVMDYYKYNFKSKVKIEQNYQKTNFEQTQFMLSL